MRRGILPTVIGMLVLLTSIGSSLSITERSNTSVYKEFEFTYQDPVIKNAGEFRVATIEGCGTSGWEERPQIPVCSFKVMVPPEAKDFRVSLQIIEERNLGRIKLVPVVYVPKCPDCPIPRIPTPDEMEKYYQSFPEELISQDEEWKGYAHLLVVSVFPMYYRGGNLYFAKRVKVRISYTLEEELSILRVEESELEEEPEEYSPLIRDLVEEVLNPGEVREYLSRVPGYELESMRRREETIKWEKRVELQQASPQYCPLSPGRYEYVLITNQALSSAFQQLVDYRNGQMPSKLVTVEWIDSNCSGSGTHVDLAEKIRNFIKDAYSVWGTRYVTLGGDYNIVPPRYVYGEDDDPRIFFPVDREYKPTDYYYAALDGDWDSDDDGLYLEIGLGENIPDFHPEVYVGRLPADEPGEAQFLIQRIIDYETNPPLGEWTRRLLFLGGTLKSNKTTREVIWHGAWSKDAIRNELVPPGLEVTAMYDSDVHNQWPPGYHIPPDAPLFGPHLPLTFSGVEQEWSSGYFGVNADSHGGVDCLVATPPGGRIEYLNTTSSLNNGEMLPIVFAAVCLTGGFDCIYPRRCPTGNCLGEHLLFLDTGGAIAYVGSTRVAYGQLYNYLDPKWELEYWFWYELFSEGALTVGEMLYEGKEEYSLWYKIEEYDQKKNFLIYNLLGDPALNFCCLWSTPRLEGKASPRTACSEDESAEFQVSIWNCGLSNSRISVNLNSPIGWRVEIPGLSDQDGDGKLDFQLEAGESRNILVRVTPPPNTPPSRGIITLEFTDGPCSSRTILEVSVEEVKGILLSHTYPRRLYEVPLSEEMTQPYHLKLVNCGNVEEEIVLRFSPEPGLIAWITDPFGRIVTDSSGNPLRYYRLKPMESKELILNLNPMISGAYTLEIEAFLLRDPSFSSTLETRFLALGQEVDNRPPPSRKENKYNNNKKKKPIGKKTSEKRFRG